MQHILYDKFDKAAIASLPVAAFPGRIVVVQSASEAEKAVDFLLAADILGVDTESRPVFKRGVVRRVALLQVATREVCFLFRLNLMDIPDAVLRLIENTRVPMVGLSLHDDILALSKRRAFRPGRFIDLQHLVPELGVQDLSLQKLYANVFHKKISKRQQLTNWEADVLTDQQKLYGATDAWACIMLYEEIERMKTTHNYQLRHRETEPAQPAQP